jgi:hypothetical protein
MYLRRAIAVGCLLVAASWAGASRLPARVCREACAPLVATVCPARSDGLRQCRVQLLRECRRKGTAVCALRLPCEWTGWWTFSCAVT